MSLFDTDRSGGRALLLVKKIEEADIPRSHQCQLLNCLKACAIEAKTGQQICWVSESFLSIFVSAEIVHRFQSIFQCNVGWNHQDSLFS